MVDKMGWTELLNLPPIIDLETAGRALGLGRTVSYQLAAKHEFPVAVIRGKNALRVSTAEVYNLLGLPILDRAKSDTKDESPVPDAE